MGEKAPLQQDQGQTQEGASEEEKVAREFHDRYWDHLRVITGQNLGYADWEGMAEHREASIKAFKDMIEEGRIVIGTPIQNNSAD